MSEQEQAALSARYARYREDDEIRASELVKANARADALLREVLSPRQNEQLALHGHFDVELLQADRSVRRYRIWRGRTRNVAQIDEGGRVLKRLCAHPIELVPDADTMIAQKLWLETAEAEFLRVANHSL